MFSTYEFSGVFLEVMNFKSVEETERKKNSQIVLNYCPPYFMIVSSMPLTTSLRGNLKLNL